MGFMKRQLELHMEGRSTPFFKKKEPKSKQEQEPEPEPLLELIDKEPKEEQCQRS